MGGLQRRYGGEEVVGFTHLRMNVHDRRALRPRAVVRRQPERDAMEWGEEERRLGVIGGLEEHGTSLRGGRQLGLGGARGDGLKGQVELVVRRVAANASPSPPWTLPLVEPPPAPPSSPVRRSVWVAVVNWGAICHGLGSEPGLTPQTSTRARLA